MIALSLLVGRAEYKYENWINEWMNNKRKWAVLGLLLRAPDWAAFDWQRQEETSHRQSYAPIYDLAA